MTLLMMLSIAGSCSFQRTECGQEAMLRLINDEIREDGRSPDEYIIGYTEQQKDAVVVGMAAKINTFYHRHYLIDTRRCRIIDLRIDQ